MKKVLAISGSTRKNASSHLILKVIQQEFKDQLSIDMYSAIDRLPHFNPDLDNENPPKEILDLRSKLIAADGVIFCTPEYVFSLPGSLKNAIEWNVSTTILSQKPVAIIVAAASGEKAFESLDLILNTLEARIAHASKLLIKGVKGKFNNGNLTDTLTFESLKSVMNSLIQEMES
ncbi:MAG: NADPH-dependent FMN reductase [Marinoscillum sp.]